MERCPNCHEYYLGNPSVCYICNYNFELKRVVSHEEQIELEEQERIEREKRIEERIKEREKEDEHINTKKPKQLSENARYEYDLVVINDLKTGEIDDDAIRETLFSHANEGWRLAHAFTNEIGKTAATIGFIGVYSQINATIDSTVLIFERDIKPKQC